MVYCWGTRHCQQYKLKCCKICLYGKFMYPVTIQCMHVFIRSALYFCLISIKSEVSQEIHKIPQYWISQKSVWPEPSWNMQMDGHDEANRRFHNYANTPNNTVCLTHTHALHTLNDSYCNECAHFPRQSHQWPFFVKNFNFMSGSTCNLTFRPH
jgi:hypothetical protein